ncbi:MAG: Asp-tRNA(Asn)/Glu-tRNA(Gln) amidotransferase subunit GatC [Bacteroidetes bacterium]|nr:Asp-tRNA(Asn)/Glu-tRNA(Gln) amidotransferase subunit GatC [Rhodothermia bacterium]MCS7155197.1 Asp-tRNA(Asn)/Glu-tRNA(Gln) amidotransferase subunit GatC [Bacteroidota bacterium]MCX7906175.1 Asp-tRNA(Asn)/Glu-tRNA(Gln) amidotransferase subunit GatC [Bacteroidota bacterium]MDW8138303.1 Asp-tRNA(Asn)/Glu-tRNA(Gln) amidotransferase subunit GatC [Bacteroidota bacterium]MDW8285987.1 Asp-tRNA(Asn)/Glu-tRNA(Gln) amidotransferase subunit GatC [Bacteroidota bacterium]
MAVSIRDVEYIADLARLLFTEEEKRRLLGELNRILAYVEKLNELDTSAVEPLRHVWDLENVARPDRVIRRFRREEALLNAPAADSEYFRVPKVIE